MIEIVNPEIETIAGEWADDLIKYVTEPLTGHARVKFRTRSGMKYFDSRLEKYLYIFKRFCRINHITSETKQQGLEILNAHLIKREYVIGNQQQMKEDVAHWQTGHVLNKAYKEIFNTLYKDFTSHLTDSNITYAHYLFQKLNIRTCPYCNRHYTFTIGKDDNRTFSCRPEFDHFYHKDKYPFLAVTFHNLVPSCHECNHGKGLNESKVNPYFKGFDSRFVLVKPTKDRVEGEPIKLNRNDIMHLKEEDQFEIDFEDANDDECVNIKSFGLGEQYNLHKDYVMEIVEKAAAYNDLMQKDVIGSFQGVFHSVEEVKSVIFGKYLSVANQTNRPFSKFTRDILNQLDIEV